MTILQWPITFVATATKVTAAFLNHVNTSLAKCADFADGGTYDPTSAVAINGAKLEMTGTSNLGLASRSVARAQAIAWRQAAGTWTVGTGGTQTNTSTGGVLDGFMDRLSNGNVLTEVRIGITPAGTHISVPGTRPSLSLYRVDGYGVAALVGSATDTTEMPTYNDPHELAIAGLTETVDLSLYSYSLLFNGEGGSSSLAGLIVGVPKVTQTCTKMSEY